MHLVARCRKPLLLVQKKDKIIGLRMLFLERLACKVDPWLVSENLDFGRFPAFPDWA